MGNSAQHPFYRNRNFPAVLSFCLFVALHVYTLIHYPEPSPDEPWNGARAASLLESGTVFSSLDEGYRIDVPRPSAVFPFLPIVLYAIPTYLLGTVDLLALRLVSLASGLFLLLGMMRIGGNFYGRRGQLAALFVTGLSKPFFFGAHIARPDVTASAMVIWSIALLSDRKQNFRAVLPGLLAGLALSFHLRSLVAVPWIGLFLLLFHGARIFRSKQLYVLAGSYLLGALVYFLIHVFPDPDSFLATWNLNAGKNRTPPLLQGESSVVWKSLTLLWNQRMQMHRSILYLPLAGALFGLILGNRRTRKFVFFGIGAFLSSLFIVRDPLLLNFIMISPSLDLLTLPLLSQFFDHRIWNLRFFRSGFLHFRRCLLGWTAAYLLLSNFYYGCYRSVNYFWDAYLARELAQDFVDRNLLPGEIVLGPQVFWLGQQERKYITWEGLKATANIRNTDLEGAFRHLRPDVFIIDNHVRYFFRKSDKNTNWFDELSLSKEELDAVLEKYAVLIAQESYRFLGNVEIYRFQWPPPESAGAAANEGKR